jgi:glyoxylase-like metal-dependent hydrolase (beta-lactamase superfamily II)
MSIARAPSATVGALRVVPFLHPQGCRSYLIADPTSGQSLALDVHLDFVDVLAGRVREEGWTLPYVVDSHTHADHPSGARALAARFGSTRITHEASGHVGVARHPAHGERIHLGDRPITVLHAPGHTPDHIVLRTEGALFSGDSLFIGAVARTDFLGGDAGQLHDTLHTLLEDLPDETVLYPGHDYAGRTHGTIGRERAENPWLELDREAFVRALGENPPQPPANMDDLLRLNRQGADVPDATSAAETVNHVRAGGAVSVIDVRTGVEVETEHVPGSRNIPLDQLRERVAEVYATPAPRLLLCRTGSRAAMARETLCGLGIGALSVVEGGIEAYRRQGGETVRGAQRMSLERQVRVVAGTLVLVASLLALVVHPAFAALALFVGAGQVFAGLSDWCGMGLLLARMPWNRTAPSVASAPTGGCAAAPPPGCAAPTPQAD